jgi:excisionase family DNA binding protein
MQAREASDSDHVPTGGILLTVAEVAAKLNVSQAWVRKGILNRTLPFTKLGRSVRFTPAQVELIILEGERPPVGDRRTLRGPGSARTRL